MGVKVFKNGAWEETTGYMVEKTDVIPINISSSKISNYVKLSESIQSDSMSLYISKHFMSIRFSGKIMKELEEARHYNLLSVNGTALHNDIIKTGAFFSTIEGICNMNVGNSVTYYPFNCYCSGLYAYIVPFTTIPVNTSINITVLFMIGEWIWGDQVGL